MYYKTLSVLALSAAAMAAPQENEWDNMMKQASDNISPEQASAAVAAVTNPASLAAAAQIPTSAAEYLVSAMPSGYAQSLAENPKELNSVANDVITGKYPDWFSEMPSSVQSQIAASNTAFNSGSTIALIPTGSSSGSASGSSVTASGSSSASPSDSASASDSSSPSDSASASESASASSSPTDNGAAVPTAMTMGVAGAAGILGLALAL